MRASVTSRQQKLQPSTTPGPGQYKLQQALSCVRAPTLKGRTRLVGHSPGEDSPGPSSYSLPSSLLRRSYNVRSAGFSGPDDAPAAPSVPVGSKQVAVTAICVLDFQHSVVFT